jgi:hypothetical protein
MELRTRWSICFIWLTVLVLDTPTLSAADKAQRIFILEVAEGGRLCGYSSEDEWGQAPKPQDPQVIAIANSVEGVLTAVLVKLDTEDTTNYDEYAMNKDGSVRQLKRTLDDVPQRVRTEQVWDIRAGRAKKTSESWMDFKTLRPLSRDKRLDYRDELPVIVRLTDFPFYSLITDKSPERWVGGKRCVRGNMSTIYTELLK